MGMELNRDMNSLFQGLHKLCCLIGQQKAGHVLDTDGICSHLFNLFCNIGPVFQGIGIAQGIGQRDLRVATSVGWATWVGMLVGTALKLALSFMMIGIMCFALWF